MQSSAKNKVRRKHTRFSPDPGTYAKIDLDSSAADFRPHMMALVSEEAYGGCGLVVVDPQTFGPHLKPHDQIKVQVGNLDPMRAEVRWRIDVDAKVIKLGLKYIE